MTATSDATAGGTAGQLRAGLWDTVNERYPGSTITKDDVVLAHALGMTVTAEGD